MREREKEGYRGVGEREGADARLGQRRRLSFGLICGVMWRVYGGIGDSDKARFNISIFLHDWNGAGGSVLYGMVCPCFGQALSLNFENLENLPRPNDKMSVVHLVAYKSQATRYGLLHSLPTTKITVESGFSVPFMCKIRKRPSIARDSLW